MDFRHAQHLLIFGETAITRNLQTGDKFVDQGRICMLLGYAKDASAGTYRFLHLKTKRVVVSCDVQWLGIMYKRHRKGHDDSSNDQSDNNEVKNENPFANNPYSPLVVYDSNDDSDIEKNTINNEANSTDVQQNE